MKTKLKFAEYFYSKIKPLEEDDGKEEKNEDKVMKLSMKNQIIRDFGIDALVAEYALIMVKYRNV